jgi:signal transduction histidine kinase
MRQQATDTLGALDRAFVAMPAGAGVPQRARERARRWAEDALITGTEAAEKPIALAYAVELLAALPPAIATHPFELRELIDTIEGATGAPRVVLARLTLGDQRMTDATGSSLEREAVLDRALAFSLAILRAESASIWQADEAGPLRVAVAGDAPSDQRDAFATATELLAGDGARDQGHADPSGEAHAQPSGVRMAAAPNGAARALVCSGLGGAPAERFGLLSAVASALSPILELCETGAAGASGAAERQLTRLKFDLHDGPLQDVVLLGEDLRLFAGQLTTALGRHPQRRRIIGRLDDLAAMLVALDGDLRRIASLLESPFLRSQSFSESLAQIASAFAERTETIPEVNLQGDLDDLTDAQHITLLALIREALSNIREHSHASRVAITVASMVDGVTATVYDDGEGFDPESALIKAAREGHLGLVGMHERVQVLGGATRIDSRPGGPTVISVSLPPRPGADDAPIAL